MGKKFDKTYLKSASDGSLVGCINCAGRELNCINDCQNALWVRCIDGMDSGNTIFNNEQDRKKIFAQIQVIAA